MEGYLIRYSELFAAFYIPAPHQKKTQFSGMVMSDNSEAPVD